MNAIEIAKKSFPDHKFPKNNFVKGIYFMTKQKLKLWFTELCCQVISKKE